MLLCKSFLALGNTGMLLERDWAGQSLHHRLFVCLCFISSRNCIAWKKVKFCFNKIRLVNSKQKLEKYTPVTLVCFYGAFIFLMNYFQNSFLTVFFLLIDTSRMLWDCNMAVHLSNCKWDQNQGRKQMLQWFPCTDAALLPSAPQSQLVCLNNESKLRAPSCLWQDCSWPDCFSRCCLLPCCCSEEICSMFWPWVVWFLLPWLASSWL